MTVGPAVRPSARRTDEWGWSGEDLHELLAHRGTATALVCGDEHVSYAELAARAREWAVRLGSARRLVVVEASPQPEAVAAYLGALIGEHPVVLTEPRQASQTGAMAERWDADVVIASEPGPRDGTALAWRTRRNHTAHALHTDLAVLLSTSGSQGEPKLVRLSRANLRSNAASIVEYLGLVPGDVAMMPLGWHYCYGLSVLHSHLLAGASVVLCDASVTEERFGEQAHRSSATTLAGVPHTFDLLERSGVADRLPTSLRLVTQAGGRLAPASVSAWARRGERAGFDFVVMYGQTEATARMAYLPPELAAVAPETIGVPVPGGLLEIDPVPELTEPDAGELVYSGPNVMMGYAESVSDLARGAEVKRLRTGDLARQRSDGIFELVGRRTRIAKIFGLRVNLDGVERQLADLGIHAVAVDGGDRLVIATEDSSADLPGQIRRWAGTTLGLPPVGLAVEVVDHLPRLPNDKVDYQAVAALRGDTRLVTSQPARGRSRAESIASIYALVLDRPASPEDSFVALGGDSLSYVETSVRLEALLGALPTRWPSMTARELAFDGEREPRRSPWLGLGFTRGWRSSETSVVLRAFAIVSIVASHANLVVMLGGAHLLLAIAGFNFARFKVNDLPYAERLREMARGIARIALPAMVVIGLVSTYTPGLGWRQVLLINQLTTGDWVEPAWHYWFIEAIVYTLVCLTAMLAIPSVARLAQRRPFAFPMGLAVVGLLTRYGVVGLGGDDEIHRAHVLFWLFAIGWAAARANGQRDRLLVSALIVASVPGFFAGFERNAYVVLGVLALVWIPTIRMPAWLIRPVSVLAAASLWIYLVHWQVYPWLEYRIPLLATVLSLLAGIGAWMLWRRVERWPGLSR